MRLFGWEGMIELASSLHDFIYPQQATRIPQKMVACPCPASTCLMMEYTFETQGKTYCRAPERFIPIEEVTSRMRRLAGLVERRADGFYVMERPIDPGFEDCPRKLRDARPALAPQPSGYREQTLPFMGTRRERRLRRLQDWCRAELRHLAGVDELHEVALNMLQDLDEPISEEDLQRLGEAMWRDYQQLERK